MEGRVTNRDLGRMGSLRAMLGDRPQPPPRDHNAEVDRIMRQAERDQAPAPTREDDDTPMKLTTEQQIASLERDGIKQLTRADLKTMKPEQIQKAREQGRLLRLMTTPTDSDGRYRNHVGG